MCQAFFYLYKIHGFIIDIILHLLHDQTCDDTDVTVHEFHPLVIFLDLYKLEHSLPEILQVRIKAVQGFNPIIIISIPSQFLHDLLRIFHLLKNILQIAALLGTDRDIVHFQIQIILKTEIEFTADRQVLRKLIVLSCILPENKKQNDHQTRHWDHGTEKDFSHTFFQFHPLLCT